MESNRDEAERCIGIALAAVKANQPERARRFLEKAQRLYPSPRVRGERRRARGGAGREGGGEVGAGGAARALPQQLRRAAPAPCGAARGACWEGEFSGGGTVGSGTGEGRQPSYGSTARGVG